MLGNFSYVNPTKLYFGEDALSHLHEELSNYGNRIFLVYGGGSIKKNGVYDAVCEILQANGKEIYEDGGVMPNPTVEKLREGCDIARKNQVDFILAVGGGSVCDYARLYLFPFIAKKIRGRNIICGWRMSPVRLFQ